ADDKFVVITIRGIGEMVSHNPDSRIELAKFDFDFNRPAAWVTLGNAKAPTGGSTQTQSDRALWDEMDAFSNQIALAFANGHPYEVLADKAGGRVIQRAANQPPIDDTRRDNLGTTH